MEKSELKSKEEILKDNFSTLPPFKRMWYKMDSETKGAIISAIEESNAQAVRYALEKAAGRAKVDFEAYSKEAILKVDKDSILSLESEILSDLK